MPTLHAWTEFYDENGNLFILDASTSEPWPGTGTEYDSGDYIAGNNETTGVGGNDSATDDPGPDGNFTGDFDR